MLVRSLEISCKRVLISCIVTAEGNQGFMIKEPTITRNEGIYNLPILKAVLKRVIRSL